MRPWRPIAALLVIAACIAFAGCGGDEEEGAPIPSATATALNAELDGVQRRLDEGSAGACTDILEGPRGPNKDKVQSLIDSMPDDVDSDVRSALQDSFDRLWDLVGQDCDDKAQKEKSQKEQEPEPEQPTETQTETQTETETETTPTDTETDITPTSPDEAPLPNDGDGDSGGGVPGTGNGNGGGGVVDPGAGE